MPELMTQNKVRRAIGILGHRIADYDTQSGLPGKLMHLCWRIGYGKG